ncbi:hypothetical protein J7K86_02460 [bacterium]|nr:hypothetical protein [bacterium]
METRYYLVYETTARAGEEITTVRIEIDPKKSRSLLSRKFEYIVVSILTDLDVAFIEASKMKEKIQGKDPLAKNFRIEKVEVYFWDDE